MGSWNSIQSAAKLSLLARTCGIRVYTHPDTPAGLSTRGSVLEVVEIFCQSTGRRSFRTCDGSQRAPEGVASLKIFLRFPIRLQHSRGVSTFFTPDVCRAPLFTCLMPAGLLTALVYLRPSRDRSSSCDSIP